MKYFFVLLTALTVLGMRAQQASPLHHTVMVVGEGVVNVSPDQVLIRSRIEHEGNDPQEVKKKNDSVVNEVLQFLKSRGIPTKNVRTAHVNLNKNYNYDSKTYSYVANQAIAIKLEDLKEYESIMSGLLQAGLNRIDGVEFQSSQIEIHKAEARKRAVLNAKKKAGEYAEPLGQSIGKAVVISEIEQNDYIQLSGMAEAKFNTEGAGGEETLAPGEMVVSSKVTVGFQLN